MEKLRVTSCRLRRRQHFDFAQYTKAEGGRQIFISHISLLIIIFCCTSIFAGAQNVTYLYDDSGNRTYRTINMPVMSPPPQDSTETVIETPEEDIVASIQNTENKDENEKSQEIYTDALSETLITIYPNPTKGLLAVKISNLPQHSISSLTLFDMHGRVITQQPLLDENKLDISAQPAGAYIMQITVGDEVTSWKIVKQ